MRGNAKSLKRNDEESKGILIGPLNGPSFFLSRRSSMRVGCSPTTQSKKSASGQILRHGWQADDRTRFAAGVNLHETISRHCFQARSTDILARCDSC